MTRLSLYILLISILSLLLIPGTWWLSHQIPDYWPSRWALPPLSNGWLRCLPESLLKTDYWRNCVNSSQRYGFLEGLLFSGKLTIILGVTLIVSIGFLADFFRKDRVITRGRKLYAGKEAEKKLKKALKKFKGPRGISLKNGLALPASFETRHWLLSGAVGAGKTVFIRNLQAQAVKSFHRCLLLDIKGDFTQDQYWVDRNGKKYAATILNPFDKRSAQWWLGNDILDLETAREFSRMFLSESSKDPFWSKATAHIMVAVMLSLIVQKGRDWSWADLAERVSAPTEDIRRWAELYYPPAVKILESEGNEAATSVLINFATDFAAICDISRYWHAKNEAPKVSLRAWLSGRDRRKSLIIGWDASRATASKSWAGAFIDLAGMYIASPQFQNNGRINFILDEFAQLPKMNGIVQSLDVGRSKGISVLIGIQSFNQLLDIYGQRAESFRSLIGNHVFAQLSAGKDAEDASRFLGNQTVREKQISVSDNNSSRTVSESWNEKEVLLMTPDEFSSKLGPDSKGVRIIYTALGLDAYLLHFPYPKTHKFRRAFEAAIPVEVNHLEDKTLDRSEKGEKHMGNKSNPFEKLIKPKSS